MNSAQQAALERLTGQQSTRTRPPVHHRFVTGIVCLLLAGVALLAHQHFKLVGQQMPALVSLIAAGVLAFVPVRAVLSTLFSVEHSVLHVVHGVGGLAFVGLGMGGVISGAPLVSHAALAPFAIMGAAQALMHSEHPRNAQQAAALRQFATSLPEVSQFTKSGDLTSPANAARAVSVLTDLVGKAQTLGQTELNADPAFQSALSRVTTHFGLTLGLDTIDQAIQKLSTNPAAASAIPALRSKLAEARQTAKAGS
jgi:hypothetical protein